MAAVTYAATGKRKTSVARVIISPGAGRMLVNGKELEAYFGRKVLQTVAVMPFETTRTSGKFDVKVNVYGGGPAGQAGAIRHGIARALVQADETLRVPLKRAGFLTRDPREVERKKAGLKGARKRPQFSKR
ncbi:MAG TPA: 30S ribosomal protein S9 [Thermoleophilia bacterium]|nr:30S ribosomal protein S9 [Thermoleophilia bacterium]